MKRGKLTILEYNNRFEIWIDDILFAYAKKAGDYEDLVHAHHFHGGYESPCKLKDFISNAVNAWIEGYEPERDKCLDEHYIELLSNSSDLAVIIKKLYEMPYQQKLEWIRDHARTIAKIFRVMGDADN